MICPKISNLSNIIKPRVGTTNLETIFKNPNESLYLKIEFLMFYLCVITYLIRNLVCFLILVLPQVHVPAMADLLEVHVYS